MEGWVRFDATHPLFADHFPGAPVTPGTLIIRFFCERARECVPDGRIAGVRRFRFRRFVAPGVYHWLLAETDNAAPCALRCELHDESGALCVSGRIMLEPA